MDNYNLGYEVLTVDDIKGLLGISRNSTYEFVKKSYKEQGPFPVLRIGRIYRVPKDKFMNWLRSGEKQ